MESTNPYHNQISGIVRGELIARHGSYGRIWAGDIDDNIDNLNVISFVVRGLQDDLVSDEGQAACREWIEWCEEQRADLLALETALEIIEAEDAIAA